MGNRRANATPQEFELITADQIDQLGRDAAGNWSPPVDHRRARQRSLNLHGTWSWASQVGNPNRESPIMRKQLACLGVGLVFVLGVCSQDVSADPITVNFDVNVTFALGPFEEIFGVPIGVGDQLSGLFTYDPSTPDSNPSPNLGIYQASGQTLRVDWGTGLTAPIQGFRVSDNIRCAPPFGECDVFGVGTDASAIPGFEFLLITANFQAPAASRQGDALPRDAAEIAAIYPTGRFTLQAFRGPGGFSHSLVGTLSPEPVAPIPEPGTLLLVGTGAIGILGRVLRQRRTFRK
jgi:PEP-CTERM motif